MRFFLFDEVVEAERNRRMAATIGFNLSGAYFEAHYRRQAVVPATLIVEALAQVAGMLNNLNHDFGAEMVLMLLDGVRAKRPVRQGETLQLEVTMMYDHPYGATLSGQARAGEEVVMEAERIVFAHEITADRDKMTRNRARFDYQTGGYQFPEGT